MLLTVGGTLGIGGETTCRYGAQVDNVLELDVVTADGQLVDAHLLSAPALCTRTRRRRRLPKSRPASARNGSCGALPTSVRQ